MRTGTCLCGATKWTADIDPTAVHYCHCSMCRRWTGSPFATLAWYPRSAVSWTGPKPVEFRSSPIAIRSHCGICGTPLHVAYDGQNEMALAIGSMDTPQTLKPTHHYGAEARLPWVDVGRSLPSKKTEEKW
jgi:hypothetical protein